MNARRVALKIFESSVKRAFVSQELWKITDPLDKADRGFVRKIVYGTLRFLFSIDREIDLLLRKNTKTPQRVRNILRLGAYEILKTDVPAYATVDEYTKMAPRELKGLVNAILRKISSSSEKINLGFSLPDWLQKTLERDLGKNMALFMEKSNGHELSLRAVKIGRDKLLRELSDFVECRTMNYSPWGVICKNGMNLKNGLFKRGKFTFQDESSQLVGISISPKRNEKILDACGGVGTKTTHILQIERKANVIYNDVNAKKTEMATSNFQRLGLFPQEVMNFDVLKYAGKTLNAKFDKVLLDAPCTALGTIGKHPDLLLRLKEDDVEKKSDVQLKMLENLWRMVKPQGELVYSVCTVTKAETDDVIFNFVSRHDDAVTVDPFDGTLPFSFNGLGVQLLRYVEGFYISKIKRL